MDLESWLGIGGAALAAAALVVAVLARKDSKRSADAADDSAASSRRSADASERASEISELEAKRRVERRDVVWKHFEDVSTPGLFVWRNDGSTTAYDVTAVVYVKDERIEKDVGTLRPGEDFVVDGSEIHKRATEEWRRAAEQGIFFGPGLGQFARISWSSELGTPSIETVPRQE